MKNVTINICKTSCMNCIYWEAMLTRLSEDTNLHRGL